MGKEKTNSLIDKVFEEQAQINRIRSIKEDRLDLPITVNEIKYWTITIEARRNKEKDTVLIYLERTSVDRKVFVNYLLQRDSNNNLIESTATALKCQIELRLMAIALQDMLEREYLPMISITNQYFMVKEDEDWDLEEFEDVVTKMKCLCNLWCSFLMVERKIEKEKNRDELLKLHIKSNTLEAKMHNLIDCGTDQHTPLNESDKYWIEKLAIEKMKRIIFDK